MCDKSNTHETHSNYSKRGTPYVYLYCFVLSMVVEIMGEVEMVWMFASERCALGHCVDSGGGCDEVVVAECGTRLALIHAASCFLFPTHTFSITSERVPRISRQHLASGSCSAKRPKILAISNRLARQACIEVAVSIWRRARVILNVLKSRRCLL